MNFSDMPDEFRIQARQIVDDAGGLIAGYYSGACQVALPSDPESTPTCGCKRQPAT